MKAVGMLAWLRRLQFFIKTDLCFSICPRRLPFSKSLTQSIRQPGEMKRWMQRGGIKDGMDGWMVGWTDDWVEKGREGQRLLKHGKQDWWERTPVAYKSLYFCQEASGGKNLNKVWGTQRKRTRRTLNKNFTTSSTRLSVCQSLKFRLPNQTQFTLDVPRGLFCQRDVPDKYCMMDHYYCICEINLLCCIMSIYFPEVWNDSFCILWYCSFLSGEELKEVMFCSVQTQVCEVQHTAQSKLHLWSFGSIYLIKEDRRIK